MLDPKLLGHARNIAHKRRIATKPSDINWMVEIVERYEEFQSFLIWSNTEDGWLEKAVESLNKYTAYVKELEKSNRFFGHRGNFASSLLPEFIYRSLHFSLNHSGVTALFSTKESVVDITLSGLREGGWAVRRKDQDLCIGLREDTVLHTSGPLKFVVPLVAIEAKTNIDINKLNGLDFSAERLKRTFPASRYLIASETLDFDLTKNYSGSIDEIYVLRKQKRSEARKNKAVYCSEVFEGLMKDVTLFINRADVSQTHVYGRLKGGKLINV